jgi:ATP-binding cassette, subfamily B (MDR/TAP), member 1
MGESGCGKSTTLQMMMRFYDPDEGRVTLDGVDLLWLRQQIGYIGQEPLLFSSTIRENLLIGKRGASEEELIEALRGA